MSIPLMSSLFKKKNSSSSGLNHVFIGLNHVFKYLSIGLDHVFKYSSEGKGKEDSTQTNIGLDDVLKTEDIQNNYNTLIGGIARVFKYEDIQKATDNFNKLIGAGSSEVYQGELGTQTVAVVALFNRNPLKLAQFFNEVQLLCRIHHQNLVSLYGCTIPHNQKLLLVYEHMPNGTVADHLRGHKLILTWATRIKIALETAKALVYLHNHNQPIIHGDVNTSNMLLDNKFQVKVANVGNSRLLPWDTTHVSTEPQGTIGYRDPEYDRYFRLSDKSDVYSFGVVLIELVSGQAAVDISRDREDIYLVSQITNISLEKFVDPKIGYHSNNHVRRMIDTVVELARTCLEPTGDRRPSMVMVLGELEKIQSEMQDIVGLNESDAVSLDSQGVLGDGNLNKLYSGSKTGASLLSKIGDKGCSETKSPEECLLPDDYKEILSRAVCPLEYSSKKDLYYSLCDHPILVDEGRMSFSLEKSTGRKCYTLCARMLQIVCGNHHTKWTWKCHSDSRFPEVTELLIVHWLDIKGTLDCKLLSRGTVYAAYLIFKVADQSQGFRDQYQNASVTVGRQISQHEVCLLPDGGSTGREPLARPDGWMEMELGEFSSGDGNGEVLMQLSEKNTGNKKTGLIIEGIEVRPM